MSTSGRLDDIEEETTVSCGDLESSITRKECTWIAHKEGLMVIDPIDLER